MYHIDLQKILQASICPFHLSHRSQRWRTVTRITLLPSPSWTPLMWYRISNLSIMNIRKQPYTRPSECLRKQEVLKVDLRDWTQYWSHVPTESQKLTNGVNWDDRSPQQNFLSHPLRTIPPQSTTGYPSFLMFVFCCLPYFLSLLCTLYLSSP